ncbi:MAG TPA: type III secretion system stator protein SctL [Paraburkholderia sp.]|jgi:type III secretion protein L
MVIWLRQAQDEPAAGNALHGVGVDGEIVRRETLAQLVELDDGYEMLRRQKDDVLAAAHREAGRIVAAAADEAAAFRADAQREFDTGRERGYDAGRREALAQWYGQTAQLLAQRREIQASLRERIAALVVAAVEKIVVNEQPAALFARASDAVDRIIGDGSHLRIRVNPDQREAAAQEFARVATDWRERGRPVPVTVIGDPSLEVGACICDTDIGSIDASLDVQIGAVRSAVARALRRVSAGLQGQDAQGEAQDAHDESAPLLQVAEQEPA